MESPIHTLTARHPTTALSPSVIKQDRRITALAKWACVQRPRANRGPWPSEFFFLILFYLFIYFRSNFKKEYWNECGFEM